MTVIVGLVEDDKVWIGADSLVSAGDYGMRQIEPKLIKKGEFLFAGTGAVSAFQHVLHTIIIPPVKEDQIPMDYLMNDLLPEIRSKLSLTGRLTDYHGVQTAPLAMMIGWRGHLYCMYGDFCLIEPHKSFETMGIGEEYARGAMYVLEKTDYSGREKIKLALDAACEYSKGCSAPYTIRSI